MTTLKIAIATIATEAGTMTIYFNGDNQPITAEAGDLIEEAGYSPESFFDAISFAALAWALPEWDLEMLEA